MSTPLRASDLRASDSLCARAAEYSQRHLLAQWYLRYLHPLQVQGQRVSLRQASSGTSPTRPPLSGPFATVRFLLTSSETDEADLPRSRAIERAPSLPSRARSMADLSARVTLKYLRWPDMVVKKKAGRDQEVQEGWTGHIIPFDLVQRTLLREQAAALEEEQSQLGDISSSSEELLDSLSEEDKGSDAVNDAGDAFVAAEVKRLAKVFRKEGYEEDSFEAKIIRAAGLLDQEKTLKAKIKRDTAELHRLTKETIEGLSIGQAKRMLEHKWVDPIVSSLEALPAAEVDTFAAKVLALSTKYAVTYSEVTGEIHALFATSSIPEAIDYYRLLKAKAPQLKVTALFDPTIDNMSRATCHHRRQSRSRNPSRANLR